MIRESSGRTRSLCALRCAALLLTVLLSPSCTGFDSSQPPLTAEVPLHLEDHLDDATIIGSEVPTDVPQPVEWRFDEPQPDWKPVVTMNPNTKPVKVERTDDSLRLMLDESGNNLGGNPRGGIVIDLPQWSGADWGSIQVRARSSEGIVSFFVGFNTSQGEPSTTRGPRPYALTTEWANTVNDGNVHTYLLRAPRGTWNRLGLWVAADKPANFEVLSVSVVSSEADYADAPAGVKAGSGTLYIHAPGRLEYRVDVPEAGRLYLGLGVLQFNTPVTFEVTATGGDGEVQTLLKETYDDPEGWAQRSVDLSHLAGQTVTLALGADAQRPGTVALWARPTLSGAGRSGLECRDLRILTGDEFSVDTVEVVAAADEVPEHCRVTGQIPPQVRFEVRLPTDWNGRLLMVGNGGYAGSISQGALNGFVSRGFAAASTDTGHNAALEPLGTFATDRQKLIDYAYRAVHVTAVTAKQIIAAHYEPVLDRAYFAGCSTGGRQGLMEAQRFPDDFDGILVGAPVLDFTSTMIWNLWIADALRSAPIEAGKLGLLAEHVYARCDGTDGLVDGLIDDPRECAFDPASDLPVCALGTDSDDCFTQAQVEALGKIYGDVMSAGEAIFPGMPLGAEVVVEGLRGPFSGWQGWVARDAGPTNAVRFGETFLRYMAFPRPAPDYDWTQFDFDADPHRMDGIRSILDATDPDLSAFKARGGKILMYFGWADTRLNPLMGVNYYEDVVEQMGPSTTDFFRLFMVPGMFHCGGGAGVAVDPFDVLPSLVDWVEEGSAPDRLIGRRVVQGEVVRTRPLCPYPQVARYKGTGSIDDAANFECVAPGAAR